MDQLAVLLRQAAPLAKMLNSDEDRERLMVLVGRKKYVELAVNLGQMESSANRAAERRGEVRERHGGFTERVVPMDELLKKLGGR